MVVSWCWLNQIILLLTKQSQLLKEMTKMPVINILIYQNSTCVKWEIETVKCNVLCSFFSAYGALVLNLSRQFHNFSLDRTSQLFIHFVSAFQSNRVLWLLWLWIHKKCFPVMNNRLVKNECIIRPAMEICPGEI